MLEVCWKLPVMVLGSLTFCSLEAGLRLPCTVLRDPLHPARLPEGDALRLPNPPGQSERCSGRTGPVGMGTCGLGHRSLPQL